MLKENMRGVTRILLVLFAGTNILYTLGGGDRILQTICIAGVLIITVLLSLIVCKNNSQVKQAVLQGLYCEMTILIAFGFSMIVGNIITTILIIVITALYICFLK
ncbi:MAG: hypothetical protein NC517_02650 [Firmicutes bacterium]|nr:hypothetical protein [Bacillota bacterium]